MQMRGEIAEAGQIHFFRCEACPQRGFYFENRIHEFSAINRRKIGHFLDMRVPDHATEPAKSVSFSTLDPHHPPFVGAKNQRAAVGVAQLAGRIFFAFH